MMSAICKGLAFLYSASEIALELVVVHLFRYVVPEKYLLVLRLLAEVHVFEYLLFIYYLLQIHVNCLKVIFKLKTKRSCPRGQAWLMGFHNSLFGLSFGVPVNRLQADGPEGLKLYQLGLDELFQLGLLI